MAPRIETAVQRVKWPALIWPTTGRVIVNVDLLPAMIIVSCSALFNTASQEIYE